MSIPSEPKQPTFTELQGQYLAFIHAYTKIHGCPPAESDMQRFFEVTAPTVHRLVKQLESSGLIKRTPRKARSIKILLAPQEIPALR